MIFNEISLLALFLWFCMPFVHGRFSTKTSYFVYNHLAEEAKLQSIPPGYKLQYFYYLGRHGNRFWSDKISQKINLTLQKLRRNGFPDSDRFEAVFKELNMDTSSSLNPAGIYFLYNIGRRYGRRIDLLGVGNTAKTLFASTSKARAFQSMASFSLGFTEGAWMPGQKIWGEEYSKFLRFFDECPAYDKSVEIAKLILKRHMEHPLFTEFANRVSERIMRAPTEAINIDDIVKLYDICGFCLSMYQEDDSKCGCEIFSDDDLDLLEYIKDMELYYLKGDAFPINIEMSVKHVDYVVDKINEVAGMCGQSRQGPFIDAFFAHAETLIPVEGMFGLFNSFNTSETDLPLTPDNYLKMKGAKRYFRGEKFAPFAGNLAFFVACPDGHPHNREPLVLAYLNERNIPLPCCVRNPTLAGGFYSCYVNKFKTCYKPRTTFDDVCRVEPSILAA